MGLQLMAEEVTVAGLQVNLYGEMVAHLQSLTLHQTKVNADGHETARERFPYLYLLLSEMKLLLEVEGLSRTRYYAGDDLTSVDDDPV